MSDNRVVYQKYRRSQIAELADWKPGFDMGGVSVSDADKQANSPKIGDKIARNPANHGDRWLVAADYFAFNFEPVSPLHATDSDALLQNALREDAERYRWLRKFDIDSMYVCGRGERLDLAIDALNKVSKP